MSDHVPLPTYDRQLAAQPNAILTPVMDDDELAACRMRPEVTREMVFAKLAERGLVYDEVTASTAEGDIVLGVVRPGVSATTLPVMFDIHGGGMIFGDRFASFLDETLTWAAEHRMVIISPEYALAPEAPAPQAARECFAALSWVVESADQLGIDPDRIILAGVSGGGGLAAAVALIGRDNGGPSLRAQMLMCPQLDDRHTSTSSIQFRLINGAIDPWPDETNRYAWNAILGHGHEHREVSIYQAPGRAEDLSGLPPTWIDVGSNEVFRDPAVAYASRLWAHGVTTELHVWAGAFHGFDVLVPDSSVSQSTRRSRNDWLTRILGS